MILAPLVLAALPALQSPADHGQARASLICLRRLEEDATPYIRAAAWRDTLDIGPWLVAIPGMLTMTRPGGIPFCSLAISADVTNYEAVTEAAAAGFNTAGPLNVLLTVGTGIYVGLLAYRNFASGSTIKLVVNGNVLGPGGAGGSGSGGDGVNGGSAIVLGTNDITIDNTNGFIFAGAGGGGGGAQYFSGSAAAQGGGGGGGFGFPGGAHGIAGGVGSTGNPGTDGSRTANGLGGSGGFDSFFGVSGGAGGNGGGAAAVGQAGGSTATASGGNGGAPGNAIVTNGVTVTWQGGFNATQVKGAIV